MKQEKTMKTKDNKAAERNDNKVERTGMKYGRKNRNIRKRKVIFLSHLESYFQRAYSYQMNWM
jgi:hypothetical protein